MKRSMLEQRDMLKEMKDNTNLRPNTQQHFPIILGNTDIVMHFFPSLGHFVNQGDAFLQALRV